MTGKIIQTETLSPEEHKQLFEWGEDIFGGNLKQFSWRPMEQRFILKIDGESIGHLGLIREQLVVDGEQFDIAGVGDVVTIPSMQRKGVAGKLMHHAIDFFLNEWKVDAGVLFCLERLVPYYQSLGWQIANNPIFVMQPTGQIRFPNCMMVWPTKRKGWIKGEIRTNSLPW